MTIAHHQDLSNSSFILSTLEVNCNCQMPCPDLLYFQNHFEQSKSFWGPILFGQFEIIFFWTVFFKFGPVQNDLDPTQTNWTRHKSLVPMYYDEASFLCSTFLTRYYLENVTGRAVVCISIGQGLL